jgi:isocitrate/isopropylmalate dehydrogenase
MRTDAWLQTTSNSSDAYEHYIRVGDDPHAVALSSAVNTRHEARRIARFAFEQYASGEGRVIAR